MKLKGVMSIIAFQILKPFGIAVFAASPLSEESPYSRLLWEFLFRGSAANPTIAQSRFKLFSSPKFYLKLHEPATPVNCDQGCITRLKLL